jgi:transcriptional regulator with XRE-family HTH domain
MRRLMLHMSQGAVAEALGLTFQQVQKYEKGVNRVSASRLQQLCKILQVPVPFFFDGAPDGLSAETTPPYVDDFLATSDGLALAKAFRRIPNQKLRHAITALVRQIATEDDL